MLCGIWPEGILTSPISFCTIIFLYFSHVWIGVIAFDNNACGSFSYRDTKEKSGMFLEGGSTHPGFPDDSKPVVLPSHVWS